MIDGHGVEQTRDLRVVKLPFFDGHDLATAVTGVNDLVAYLETHPIQERLADGAQFIIATHSPILLATPGATVYSFDQTPPAPVAWDETEHVRLTRDFLNRLAAFLKHLRE